MREFAVTFDIEDVPGLKAYIEGERESAREDAYAAGESEGREQGRNEATDEFEDYTDLSHIVDGGRDLYELAAAIRRGDRAEAELMLDRIAEEMGARAVEQVQQARFSNRSRVPA